MFSLIYSVENGGNLPVGHKNFAIEVCRRLKRCVLLQQVFLPHSDIHHDETTVFHSAAELRALYELFGGDVALKDHLQVELAQVLVFAEAFFGNQEPEVSFSIGEIVDDPTNIWLPDMHIGVRTDYSQFADGIRRVRREIHEAMKDLAQSWASDKTSFDDILERELAAFGPTRKVALGQWFQKALKSEPDPMSLLDTSMPHVYFEYKALKIALQNRGVPELEHGREIGRFWDWDRTREIPYHKLSSYLFAAVVRRVSNGAKKIVDRGLMNDIAAISTYAPYMNAMFVDRTCAELLYEEPLISDLDYRAKIFSLKNSEEFIVYLDEIEKNTPDIVREFAIRIYNLE